MEAPQNRRFNGKIECHLLWPTYIGEKGRTLSKMYGIKARCYWEHLGEPIGNLKRTCWEQRKNEKILPHLPTQNLKEKKSRHFECMLSLPIGYMKFLFPKLFATTFGLGITYPRYKLGVLIYYLAGLPLKFCFFYYWPITGKKKQLKLGKLPQNTSFIHEDGRGIRVYSARSGNYCHFIY
jgi:hypothetical protein